MTLPLLWISLGWTAGVLLSFLAMPPFVLLWCALGVGLPFLWFLRGKRSFLAVLMILVCVASALYTQLRYDPPADFIGNVPFSNKIYLEGIVQSDPRVQLSGRRQKVSFVLSSKNFSVRKNGQYEYHETSGKVQVFLFQPEDVPEYGDRVRIGGTIQKPGPALNPGNFDYRNYLEQRGIPVLLQGYGPHSLKLIRKGGGFCFFRSLNRVRKIIGQQLDRFFEPKNARLFKALIIGERKEIETELNEDFIKTGTSHLLAISGLNIALVIGSFYGGLIGLRVPQKMAAGLGLAVTAAYVMIAGAEVPVVRAGWMAASGFVALLLERERSSFNTFFLAFFLMVLAEPKSLTYVSFQLSFISVFALIVMFRFFSHRWGWAGAFFQTLAASVGTFPVVAYYFHIFSPVSFLANLLAIPFFHLALLTSFAVLLFSWIPLLGSVLVWAAGFWLKSGVAWIHFCAAFPFGYFYLRQPCFFQMICYYVFLLGVIALHAHPRFSRPAWLKPVFWSFLLLTTVTFFWGPREPRFSLTLLAVGRNEVMHLNVENKAQILINTGRISPKDQTTWLIGPYLRSQGIKTIHAVILTDFAKKHAGGLPTLRRNFLFDYLGGPRPDKRSPSNQSYDVKRSRAAVLRGGDRILLGERGDILVLDDSDSRLSLLISYRGRKMLFVPAVMTEQSRLIEKLKDNGGEIDLLILPSFSKNDQRAVIENWFESIDPGMVVIPHEDPRLKAFLDDRDIPLLTTEKYGALTFDIERIKRKGTENRERPFWVRSYLQGVLGVGAN